MSASTGNVKIFFLNNEGGGFSDYVEVPQGTTVSQFFTQRLRGQDPNNYLIRVNRQGVPAGQLLQEGDRLSITPRGVKGAK